MVVKVLLNLLKDLLEEVFKDILDIKFYGYQGYTGFTGEKGQKGEGNGIVGQGEPEGAGIDENTDISNNLKVNGDLAQMMLVLMILDF